MSVAIPPAPPIAGVLPQPVIGNDGRMHSVGASSFNAGKLLAGGAIGAAAGGVLGGVALLGKFALPILGKVTSIAGLAKFGLVGGVIGLGIAAAAMVIHARNERQAVTPNVPGFAMSDGWAPVARVF